MIWDKIVENMQGNKKNNPESSENNYSCIKQTKHNHFRTIGGGGSVQAPSRLRPTTNCSKMMMLQQQQQDEADNGAEEE